MGENPGCCPSIQSGLPTINTALTPTVNTARTPYCPHSWSSEFFIRNKIALRKKGKARREEKRREGRIEGDEGKEREGGRKGGGRPVVVPNP